MTTQGINDDVGGNIGVCRSTEALNGGTSQGVTSTACGFLRGCGTAEWKLGILWRLKAQMKATIGPSRIAESNSKMPKPRTRSRATAIEVVGLTRSRLWHAVGCFVAVAGRPTVQMGNCLVGGWLHER
jgi:hypothetical protein